MPNYKELVVPSSDVQLYITVDGLQPLKLETGTRFSRVFAQTVSDIFAIGEKDPIAIIDLNCNYTATLVIQSGEYNTLLDAINASLDATSKLYASMLEVPSFTLTCSYAVSSAGIPKAATVSLLNCKVSEDSDEVNANDPQTLTTISVRGRGIMRSVIPASTTTTV